MRRRNPSRTRASGSGDRGPENGERRVVRIHRGHPRLRLDRRAVATAIHELDAHAGAIVGADRPRRLPGIPRGELSLAFLTDAALAALHGRFLDDPSATDVITFAGDPSAGQAGEICVSVDAARRFACQHRRDFSEELTLYLVHGWLHLGGHDDRAPAARRRMRAAEARAMALLRAVRTVPEFSFA